jgi:hypothetical protein
MKSILSSKVIAVFTFLFFIFVTVAHSQTSTTALTPGGANSELFRFTKQVWLNPSIILLKQRFEQETHVKLLLGRV